MGNRGRHLPFLGVTLYAQRSTNGALSPRARQVGWRSALIKAVSNVGRTLGQFHVNRVQGPVLATATGLRDSNYLHHTASVLLAIFGTAVHSGIWSYAQSFLQNNNKKKKKLRDREGRNQRAHLGIIVLSMAHRIWSQFLQNIARRVTAKKVPRMWKRLFIMGETNLARVDTHTRMTVMKARTTLMHFPSSTLAFTASVCRVCCSCWCNSSLEMRVWQDSKASCGAGARGEQGSEAGGNHRPCGGTHAQMCRKPQL